MILCPVSLKNRDVRHIGAITACASSCESDVARKRSTWLSSASIAGSLRLASMI